MRFYYTATLRRRRDGLWRRYDGPACYPLAVQLRRRGQRWQHPWVYLVRTVALAEALTTYAIA